MVIGKSGNYLLIANCKRLIIKLTTYNLPFTTIYEFHNFTF